MSEEVERSVAIKNEPIFDKALEAAQTDKYLGDYGVLDSTLRLMISRVLEKEKPGEVKDQVRIESKRLAKILLGRDSNYVGMHNWNEPGHVDVFCAKWLGSSEKTPDLVMEHAGVKFFGEILDLVGYAGTDGVLQEQWQWQLAAILNRYIYTFMGVDGPTQAVLDLGKEEPGVIEDVEESEEGTPTYQRPEAQQT